MAGEVRGVPGAARTRSSAADAGYLTAHLFGPFQHISNKCRADATSGKKDSSRLISGQTARSGSRKAVLPDHVEVLADERERRDSHEQRRAHAVRYQPGL